MTVFKDAICATVLNSIADGVFTVDLEWNITAFNRSAEKILGISADLVLGRKCWEVLHSSLCDGHCALKECLANQTTLTNKSIFVLGMDGTKIPVSISAAPLRDEQGRLLGGVETFRDLTDIHLLRREVESQFRFENIIGKSAAMTRLFGIMQQVAQSPATVLLTGESGTGKELFARALHALSLRAKMPFVAVNCGALPETLLESELFGYKAGAFTDARHDKPGRFQLADKGTIFLDEIGDMPPAMQVKLLRVLQERAVEPLGSVKSIAVDVRIIAATNHDLAELIAAGLFRQDLYYRLNVAQLVIPPLRERLEDIPILITHFITRLNLIQNKQIQGVSEDVKSLLMRYPFPGNVRELQNIIEFAFILCNSGFIQLEHLPDNLLPAQPRAGLIPSANRSLEDVKCLTALDALERHQGRVMAASRELQVSKGTLRRLADRGKALGLK